MNETKKISYFLERFAAGVWQHEGPVYDSKEEAIEELKFHRRLYRAEKWRITAKTGCVLYRRENPHNK